MRKKKEWPLDQKKKYELYHTHMRIGAVQKQDLVMDIAVHMPQTIFAEKTGCFGRNRWRGRVYDNRGIWHNRLSHLQISKNLKKISYEPHRNFIQSQTSKNLLRKWSRFCKNIL